jgi:hypothetical protein
MKTLNANAPISRRRTIAYWLATTILRAECLVGGI